MKKLSILIPCYNEIENVELMAQSVINVIGETLPMYDYELLFIDNCSTDGTTEIIADSNISISGQDRIS